MLSNGASLAYVLPEAVLAVTAGLILAVRLLTSSREINATVALLGTVAALLTSVFMPWPSSAIGLFHGNLIWDGVTAGFRPLFILAGLSAVLFSSLSSEVDGRDISDTAALVLSSVIGMSFMAGASDLLTMYISMELVGILSYVLAGLKREDQRSSEAALKYAVYGGAASGVMLFGISLMYGVTGDTSIEALRPVVSQAAFQPLILLAMVMVMAGIFYKVAAVPFHMWCPDVYQGAPTPMTAFFSVGPKAAGFALMMRLMQLLFGKGAEGLITDGLMLLIGLIAVATMTLGNLAAMNQRSVKRMLAYSSIAHAGYLLLGIATLPAIAKAIPDLIGFRAVFLYLVIYLFMNLGAFFAAGLVVDRLGNDDISSFCALGQRSPIIAALLTIFLFSLTGIPPTAGFVGKFYLFYALIKQGGAYYFVLALIGVINSFVSLFYYARVMKVMYLERSADRRPIKVGMLACSVLAVLAGPILLFGIWFEPLVIVATHVVQ